MKSTTMGKISAMGILLASTMMQSFSLAYVDPVNPDPATAQLIGNTIQIVNTTTAATDFAECDSRGQDRAYYVGSQVAMKVQALPQQSNKRIVATSRILKYDPYDVFDNLSFPRISNIVPNTTITANKPVIVVDADDTSTFKQPTTNYTRGQLAAQLSSNMHYQGISTTSTSNLVNYTYLLLNASTNSAIPLNSNNLIPIIQQTYVCFNYYLAYCGDHVVDNYVAGGNGDGINGIMVDGSIVPRHGFTTANPPHEQCDDGNTIDTDACNNQCQIVNVGPPTCTSFAVTPITGNINTQYDFACLGTNATSYQVSVTNNGTAFPGTPFIYTGAGPFLNQGFGPLLPGSNIFTCTIFGANGTSVACPSQTVPVGTPVAPTCTLHAYTTGGNTIADGSTIIENSSARFRCELTNAAATSTNPYTFNFNMGGVPSTVGPQISSGHLLASLTAGVLNANCTINGVTGLTGSCAMSLNVGQVNPNLQISKTLVPNPLVPDGKYRQGDLVTFRIDFANIGTSPATHVRVRDVFPNSLTYISTGTQLVGVQLPYSLGTYNYLGNLFVEYSGFNLQPGQTGYMIVQGIFKGYEWAYANNNHVYVTADNAEIKDAHLFFDFAIPNANVTIDKTLTSAGPFYPGSTFGFTLTLHNNGDSVSNLQIQDIWPSNASCVIPNSNYTSNVGLQTGANYSWTLPGTFNQGQTITINLTGQIGNDAACAVVGSYTNVGTYTYVLGGITHTGSASAVIPVAPTPYANIDFNKIILQAGSARGDTVSYKITYKNNGTTPLSNFVISDFWPATLNYVSASPLPSNPPYGNSCAAGCTLLFYPQGVLAQGSVGEIILTGTIK